MACIPDPLGSGSAPNSRYKPRPAAIKANRPNIRCIGAHLFAARRSTVCCLIGIGSVAAAGQHTVNAIHHEEPSRQALTADAITTSPELVEGRAAGSKRASTLRT